MTVTPEMIEAASMKLRPMFSDVMSRRFAQKIIEAALASQAQSGETPAPPPQTQMVGSVTATSKAMLDVSIERHRQVTIEGFDASHDDMATRGQLALAAVSYAYEASRTDRQRNGDKCVPPRMWPWDDDWWKPTDRRRDLVKAAALIIAEIERLDRAALSAAPEADQL